MTVCVACAAALALVSGAMAGKAVIGQVAAMRTRRVAEVAGDALVGVRALRRPAAWLIGRSAAVKRFARDAREVLGRRGVGADEEAVVSSVAAVAIGAGLVTGLFGRSVFWGLAGAAGAVAIFAVGVSRACEKERKRLRDEATQVVQALDRCLQSGMTLQQTFAQVGAEISGPSGKLFSRAADMLDTGAPASEALAFIREESGVEELAFLAMALDVQHRAGGSMRQVMESAMSTVTARMDLVRQLEVQTAQAKLSAEVITLLPFGLLAVLSLISPGFLQPLLSSVAGYAVIGIAIALQAGGVLMVRRILKGAAE